MGKCTLTYIWQKLKFRMFKGTQITQMQTTMNAIKNMQQPSIDI
jgi:hypothetical protein